MTRETSNRLRSTPHSSPWRLCFSHRWLSTLQILRLQESGREETRVVAAPARRPGAAQRCSAAVGAAPLLPPEHLQLQPEVAADAADPVADLAGGPPDPKVALNLKVSKENKVSGNITFGETDTNDVKEGKIDGNILTFKAGRAPQI